MSSSTINIFEIMDPIIPNTTFPSLDTAYRNLADSHVSRRELDEKQSENGSEPQLKTIKKTFPSGEWNFNHSTIQESYAQFVAAFTGHDEIAIYTSSDLSSNIPTTDNPRECGIIRGHLTEGSASDGDSRPSISWEFIQDIPHSTKSLDFALHITKTLNSHDSRIPYDIKPFTIFITVEDASIIDFSLLYDTSLLPGSDAPHIFDAAVAYLRRSSSIDDGKVTNESILNFPPLIRPPSFIEDQVNLNLQDEKALLHSAFERRVAQYPNRVALDFLQSQNSASKPTIRRTFTYTQLNEIATSLAEHILISRGQQEIGSSRVVPVLLSTSAELYIAYLAILKAGLAFCPLPIEAPPQRLQDIHEDIMPQIILGSERYRHKLSAVLSDSLKWIDVESFIYMRLRDGITGQNPLSFRVLASSDENDVAYIMYTSGSTGKPKGVQITHLAAACSIASHAITSPLPPSSEGIPRWFQFAAPTFDPSLMEIFVTLSTGATLCSASRDLTLTNFEAVVSELQATVMMATPSMAALLRRSKLTWLRSLWTMGETVLRKNIDDFARLPSPEQSSELCNAYGPTEAAINCTLIPNFHPGDRGSIIGPALPTCSLFVLDTTANSVKPVPRGFSGELAIGGPQVSIGYLNRPDQNAKSFVISPEFGRLYLTGDKARIVTNRRGQYVVEFLGRLDTSQVKLSGRRVDLGEIDTVVSSCKGIKEAVTVSYKRFANQAGSEEAVCFIILEGDNIKEDVEMRCRENAARLLPSYMCPSKYFVLSEMPRSLAVESAADLDSNTNLFSLGIDSLKAIRFLQLARDAGITELSIADVLGGHYIHHSVHHINSSVDVSRLKHSWITAVRRHESYRMVFVAINDVLSPFGQCVLKESCTLSLPSWKVVACESDDPQIMNKFIESTSREAEDEIVLYRPPYQMTLIQSPTRTFFTFSVFHGIFDGASLQLLFDEVDLVYRGSEMPKRTGISTAINMHYESDATQTVEFWSSQLKGCDPVPFPSLTGLKPETMTKLPFTSSIKASIGIDDLRDGAMNCSTSPLSILQAAWALILTTYKDSIHSSTFGSVISGRLDEDSKVCMGPTFTTVPINIPAQLLESESTSVSSILHEIAKINAESLGHLQIPLNSIVAPSGGLYYDTLLAFQDFSTGTNHSELWSKVDYPAMANDFAVMIEIWPEVDGSLRLRATYTDEFLHDASATLMLQQFSDLISFFIHNPEKPYINGRYATAPSIYPQILSTELTGPSALLHTDFERNAKMNPEDVALIFINNFTAQDPAEHVKWTFAELDRKANRLASYLVQRYGPLEDKVVPFSIYKSPELYVAILGILKAGGAWCPIDPTFPASRRHDLILRTDANMLLVANDTVNQDGQAIPQGVSLIDISEDKATNSTFILDETKPANLPIIRSNSMAYLIWTSGTTGLPKGVQVQHSAAATAMQSLKEAIPASRSGEVRCLQFSQPTFDVFVQDLFYTWGLRGTVIAAAKDVMLGSFPDLANMTNATHAHLTPAFATIVPRTHCKTLEVVTMIGEALPQPVADDWSQNILAYNTYGPAEVSVVSTVKQFGGYENSFKSTNVGLPLPSVGVFVINNDRFVMRNGVGELALSGPQVARGYWKDPAKTEERFHWNESCGAHIYMTGDIVRQLHDGSLEFVGRRDDLVKINGMRVELSEISFALNHCHPDTEQAVTMLMARPDRPKKVLVTLLSAPSISAHDLLITNDRAVEVAKAAMAVSKANLPEHMIPSVFVVLNRIPVTASAKIDRKALSAAYEALDLESWESNFSSTQDSNWTGEEERLLQHFATFLGTESKTFRSNSRLGTLGFDSIAAVRFTARLKTVGYKVSAAHVLHCQTIADLCNLLDKPVSKSNCLDTSHRLFDVFHREWFPKVVETSAIRDEAFVVCPTLSLQENLLSETFRNYEYYWSNHFFDLSDNVDLELLKAAWFQVACDNEALRVGFLPTASVSAKANAGFGASTFLQLIYEKPSVDWSVIAVTNENFSTSAKSYAQQIARKHQTSAFINSPWAVVVFERDDVRTMMLSIHHTIHDGPSLKFIIDDLHEAYVAQKGLLSKRHQIREAIAISFMKRTSPQEDMVFWKNTLKDFVSEADDSVEQIAQGNKTRTYNTISIPLSVPISKLQTTAQEFQCSSANSILRAAWACIVSDFLETDQKIVIGEVLSERLAASSLEDIVGPLVSLTPVPIFTSGTAREIVVKHDSMNVAAYKHRDANPGMLRKLIGRPKSQPLYPAVFVFHPRSTESEQRHEFWTEIEDFLGLNVEHDLTLNVEENATGGFDLVVSVESGVLDISGVEILTKQLDALVTAMISYPDTSIRDLTNYFPTELIAVSKSREMKLDPIVDLNNPLCWFEHWAETHPDWAAAEIADSISRNSSIIHTWSYSRLNHEANRVAAFISSHGIHGRMIGMCLGRTLVAFAVTVGIFKSGNTYLPIDESLPTDRKVFLLKDSDAAIFFSEESVEFAPGGCLAVNVNHDQFQTDRDVTQKVEKNKDSVAYLLYTSGSTGNPKGVLISCGNLTSFCEAQSEFICENVPTTRILGGVGKFLGLASRAFDVHVAEMFLAWRHGLSCITGNKSMLLDDLPMALQELKVTHAGFVPSLLDQCGLIPSDVPLLKYLGVGGEKISQRTLETWGDSNSVTLINAYGPTEATIGCASSACVNSKENMRNVGRPLGDTVAHVLIPGTLTYAKRGVEGELCLTGSLVGIGYHNRDTGAFIENFHGSRMYRTGDLVRLMPDDTIEIFGRSDDQTKIRGQRLELGEVSEAVRALLPDGSNVSSLITKHPKLSRMQLISFVASRKATEKDEKVEMLDSFEEINVSIRAGCRERLPAYMVPDVVIPINFLPLAAMSGKADVKQLKSIFASIPLNQLLSAEKGQLAGTKTVTVRDLDEQEIAVVEILKSVVPATSAEFKLSTNIFEIGVDSLVAISLSTLMRKAGYTCSVADVLSIGTVEELALLPRSDNTSEQTAKNKENAQKKLARAEAAFRESIMGKKSGMNVETVRHCLPVQEAVVARSLNKDSGALYINHITFELASDIDKSKVIHAWKSCATDNEILRTCFCQINDDILQVVLKNDSFDMPWAEHVYTKSSRHCTPAKMQEAISLDIMQNIENTPPIRLNFFTEGASKSILLISMHHALYDAESLTILMQDILMRYQGMPAHERPSAGALVEYVASQDELAAKNFWVKRLGDYSCPPILSEEVNEDHIEAQVSTRILKSSLRSLEAFASRLHVTLPCLTQAIFGLAMAKLLSINDFVFGLVLSGRTVPVPNIEKLLAPTITTVPQRIDLRKSDATVLDILTSLQKFSGQMLQFQHSSPRSIHKWVEADRPLFNCLFSFIKTGEEEADNGLWKLLDSYMPPDYPFAVEFEARHPSNDLVIRAGYTSEFGSTSKVDNLLEMIELLIDTISKSDDISIKSLGIQPSLNFSSSSEVFDDGEELPDEQTIKIVLLGLGDFASDNVSRNSTFFRLGIDSVIAIRFAKELRSAGLEVSSSDIGRYPSIAALARAIASKSKIQSTVKPIEVKTSSLLDQHGASIPLLTEDDKITDVYASTPLQTGILTQTVATGGKLYLHHPAVKLSANVDIERLKKAWASVIESHDILRTTFHYFEGSANPWLAAVHENPNIQWVEEQASGWIDKSIEKIVENTSFPTPDSFSSTPLKVTILRSSFMKVLVISIHHSLYDGWSLPLIFDSLSTAYSQGISKPMTPFSDAAKLINERQGKSVEFWLNRLDNYQSIPIPSSINPTQTTSFATTTIQMPVSEILQRCQEMNINLQSAALLAYAKTLFCFVKRRDIVFGHVVSGRSLPLPDVEKVLGPLFNTVPFRIALDNPLLGNQDYASQIQDVVVQGQENQHASLPTIQRFWRQKNIFTDGALLDALFVFQKVGERDGQQGEKLWTLMDMEDSRDTTEYGLNVEIEQGTDKVIISAGSPAGRINTEDLGLICSTFRHALRDILENPKRSVVAYPEQLHDLPLESTPKSKTEISEDHSDVANAPMLEVVRAALAEVANLPTESVALQTSIFSLGVDSIAAIRVASICRRRDVPISVADILQGNSLGGIVRILVAKSKTNTQQQDERKELLSSESKANALSLLKYPEHTVEEILPVIAGQEYHLASWLKSGRTFYEPTWAFQACEKIDATRLSTVWKDLQLRHPILRTVFTAPTSEFSYQIVLKPEVINDETFTILPTQSTNEDLVSAVKRQVYHWAQHPATLFTPPISLCLVQTKAADAVLFKIHHSLYDAWSMTALIKEFCALYTQPESVLPATPDFVSFVKYTYSSLSTPSALAEQKSYWNSALRSAQRTILTPVTEDKENEQDMTQTFVWIKRAIPHLSSLHTLARANGTSVNTIIMLAFSRALARITGTTNPTFGFFQVGRSSSFEGAETVLAPTVNLLPVSIAASAGREKQILETIQRDMSKRVAWEQSRLMDVVTWARGVDTEEELEPLFNASLNLLFHKPGEDSIIAKESKELLKPLNIGVPTDFAPDRRIEGETTVQNIDTKYLAKRNLFVDVGEGDNDCVDFGVKVDKVLMGEVEVKSFVNGVVRELEEIREALANGE
ncbi:hypothetical protein SS1G_06185 [Sclerotinia sclerotiorum 1980 UF-70]|uniref:Carrier domain-containing protein n=1 Tax=Sclerotinia sclerotiorum (strain ATCC 18683 / 1980 / Ss-1) TaxID=665079 RepID=A7ELI8_SCLS1|nr:hypothetical protein SS1G_06185 [Sclerotinia sclerotiorum 1980 UF-70]EDO03704.1 hypothetical protein SS1G_06185 [Sclerotinia sclerotiorum 1980 UF-70]